ncbi:MAG: amidohydrolase family protein [Thermoleophilaceae bacterium]
MARKTLLRGGTIVTMDPSVDDLERGDVLIEGERIAAVGPRIDVEADETIDATGAIVMPGMIDCHVHLWQTAVRGVAANSWGMEYFGIVHPLSARFRPDDMFASTYAGALELLSCGVTTALDFCHSVNSPEHADASWDALTDAGIRALFGYGFRDRPEVEQRAFASLDDRIRDAKRLHGERDGGSGRIRIAIALNNIDHLDADTHGRELGCARELGARATVHSNLPAQVTQDAEAGLLGEDVLWVHCGAVADPELALLAQHGGAVVSTPEIETGLMAIAPVVGRAVRHGVPVGLGIDVPSAVNGDLLTQLRVTYALDRLLDSLTDRVQGRPPRRSGSTPTLDGRRVLELATIEAARVLGLDGETGSLTPGKLADVTVLSTEPFGRGGGAAADHVVFQAGSRSVRDVLVGGEARVRDGQLVGVDRRQMRERLEAASDWVLGRTPGAKWNDLDPELRARYEAHQGTPVA